MSYRGNEERGLRLKLRTAFNMLVGLVAIRFVRSIKEAVTNARERWADGMDQEFAWLHLVSAVVGVILLWNWAFGHSLVLGITFVTSAIVAFLRGDVFSHPMLMFGVGIGVAIGVELLPEIRGDIWSSLMQGDLMGAAVFGVMYLLFHDIKNRFQRGDFDGDFAEDELDIDEIFEDDDLEDDDLW